MLTPKQAKKIAKVGEQSGNVNLLNEVEIALSEGVATSFIDDNIGIIITKPIFANGVMGMFVWVAVGSCKDAFPAYLPFLEMVARDSNCKFLEFRTKRKGFKRYATKFNFIEARPSDGFFVFTKEV